MYQYHYAWSRVSLYTNPVHNELSSTTHLLWEDKYYVLSKHTMENYIILYNNVVIFHGNVNIMESSAFGVAVGASQEKRDRQNGP
jgi:hypothetical protein